MRKIILLLVLGFYGTLLFAQTKETPISTPAFAELAPKLSFDGSKLIYASNNSGTWQFFECNRIYDSPLEKWSEPKAITLEIGAVIGVEIKDPAYNMTGNRIYFAANFEDSYGGFDIYYADRIGDIWSKPINAGNVINSFMDESAPVLSVDENFCYFVRTFPSEKKDEFINKIYFSRKKANEQWSVPAQLISTINAVDENYPFLGVDNKTLFFSSKRLKEPDGYNIMVSKMYAENIWSDPVPIKQINTNFDITSPSIAANSNELYYAQSTTKKNQLLADIYSMPIDKKFAVDSVFILKGVVRDSISKVPLAAEIVLSYSENMKELLRYKTMGNSGTYYLFLKKGVTWSLEILKQGYSHAFYDFDAGYKKDILQKPVIKDFSIFSQAKLNINVFDEVIFEPLKCTISVRDEQGVSIANDKINYDRAGRVSIEMEIGKAYDLSVTAENYQDYYFTFDLSGVVQFNEFEEDAALVPIKTPFEFNITDAETNAILDSVEVVINNLDKKERFVKQLSKTEQGKLVLDLRVGNRYAINVNSARAYGFYNDEFIINESNNKPLAIQLVPLKPNAQMPLNGISFENKSDVLKAGSYKPLAMVVKMLNDNPQITIEIAAHTNNVGSVAYNQKLSSKRAEAIQQYLVQQGILHSRLLTKAYGATMPLLLNNEAEDQAKNDRMVLHVVDLQNQEK